MPVVPNRPAPPPAERNDLVEQLAAELTREGEGGEPVIIENPVPPGAKFFPIVVWSAWGPVSFRQRAGIILDAYRKRDQDNPQVPPKAPLLTIATGMTWEEAEQKNLFPFSIEPDPDAEEDPQAVRDAMLAEGAVATASGLKLLLRTRAAANAAFWRLEEKLPKADWILVQTMPPAQSD